MTKMTKWTPWGEYERIKKVCPGLWSVDTPGHGGYRATKEALIKANKDKQVAYHATYEDDLFSWFEEDCEWAFIALMFPEYFKNHIDMAKDTIIMYWPDLAAINGLIKIDKIIDGIYYAHEVESNKSRYYSYYKSGNNKVVCSMSFNNLETLKEYMQTKEIIIKDADMDNSINQAVDNNIDHNPYTYDTYVYYMQKKPGKRDIVYYCYYENSNKRIIASPRFDNPGLAIDFAKNNGRIVSKRERYRGEELPRCIRMCPYPYIYDN